MKSQQRQARGPPAPSTAELPRGHRSSSQQRRETPKKGRKSLTLSTARQIVTGRQCLSSPATFSCVDSSANLKQTVPTSCRWGKRPFFPSASLLSRVRADCSLPASRGKLRHHRQLWQGEKPNWQP